MSWTGKVSSRSRQGTAVWAERAAEIAGKQAELEREAQEQREQKLKPRR
jgi:hypothetical protein